MSLTEMQSHGAPVPKMPRWLWSRESFLRLAAPASSVAVADFFAE